MGLASYIASRICNALLVIIVATIICSIVFNKLIEINIEQRIHMRVEETIQRELGTHGIEGLIRYLNLISKTMEEYGIKVEIEGRLYGCADVFRNSTFVAKLKEEGLLESVARTCIERFIIEDEKRLWGLDKPYIVRVFLYTYKTITFSLGMPYGQYQQFGEYKDTFELLMLAMSRSIALFTVAYMINIAISLYLGLRMARAAGGLLDRFISIMGMVTHSFPLYWLGLIVILVFSVQLGWFPLRAWESPPESIAKDPLSSFIWWAKHLALPIMTIVFVAVGPTSYVVRNMVLNVMQEDFVWVARAKGLPERYIMYRHVLRAASPPIATTILLGLLNTFFGAIISERVFQWPGMGTLYWLAISNGDIPVLMGLNYLFVLLFVLIKVFLDIIYCILDPRVRVTRIGGH